MTGRPRLVLVSPRPPRADGQGDQRRASEILAALSADWEVDVVSWLPDVDEPGGQGLLDHPLCVLRALLLSIRIPLHAAYVQGHAPAPVRQRLARAGDQVVLFVTDRAVPAAPPPRFIIDFIDDLGSSAIRRVDSARGAKAAFWRWEGRRLRRLDQRLVEASMASIAHSGAEAASISPRVTVIPLSTGAASMAGDGCNVVFIGNLFYEPNHEAALWVCQHLAPYLAASGVEPGRIVIAGRRPLPALREQAARAGVELRADVPDLSDLLREAAVVLSPMRLGAGAQYKVIDAVGAGRPCVLTPLANEGLGLADGRAALVRPRDVHAFGDAVVSLLADPALRRRLAEGARRQLSDVAPEAVAQAWRSAVARATAMSAQAD